MSVSMALFKVRGLCNILGLWFVGHDEALMVGCSKDLDYLHG